MNRFFRSLGLGAALALTLTGAILPSTAQAYDLQSTAAVNVAEDTAILHGYDAVAYFTSGTPTLGNARFSTTHDGATYRFASAANLKAFQANPSSYAPQFGGFCALGAALGKKLDVDPTQFKVVDGKLYLNLNAEVFEQWSKDVPGNIATANTNWPAIKDQAPAAL